MIEVAPGHDPYLETQDAADMQTSNGNLFSDNWANVDGVKERRLFNGEKATMNSAMLPAPDFTGFNAVCDERMTRGLNTNKSQFTRSVDSSYSAGMQERQIDNPVVDQLRENFTCAWNKVHGWFLDSLYLSGAVQMPGSQPCVLARSA